MYVKYVISKWFNGLFGPVHFYKSKYKEKTNIIHSASYSSESFPFSMDNAFLKTL